MSDNEVLAKWEEMKTIVESLELDVAKAAKGVSAAGVRSRRALRSLKTKTGELVKLMLTLEKSAKEEK
jgi:hypothetical protein